MKVTTHGKPRIERSRTYETQDSVISGITCGEYRMYFHRKGRQEDESHCVTWGTITKVHVYREFGFTDMETLFLVHNQGKLQKCVQRMLI